MSFHANEAEEWIEDEIETIMESEGKDRRTVEIQYGDLFKEAFKRAAKRDCHIEDAYGEIENEIIIHEMQQRQEKEAAQAAAIGQVVGKLVVFGIFIIGFLVILIRSFIINK